MHIPSKIFFRGYARSNPHIIKEHETGDIIGAVVRGTAIGINQLGNVVIIEQKLLYDISIGYTRQLAESIKHFPESGFYVTNVDDFPKEVEYRISDDTVKTFEPLDVAERDAWKYHKIDDAAGGMYINHRAPNIINITMNHINNKWGISSSIITRLKNQLYRAHPAIGVSEITDVKARKTETGETDMVGEVELHVWTRSIDEEQFDKIKQAIKEGRTVFDENTKLIRTSIAIKDVAQKDPTVLREEVLSGNKIKEEEDAERMGLIEIIQSDPDKYFDSLSKPIPELSNEQLKKIIKENKDVQKD